MKAFPTKGWNGHEETIHEGMDLRDYFAAKVMQGIVDSSIDCGIEEYRIAESCYRIADAMMVARNEKN